MAAAPCDPIQSNYGGNIDRDILQQDKLEVFTKTLTHISYAVVVVDANSEQPTKGYVRHRAPALARGQSRNLPVWPSAHDR